MRVRASIALIASALISGAAGAQELVVNGSFETGVDQSCGWVCIGAGESALVGWTIERNTVDRCRVGGSCSLPAWSWVSADGEYSLDLKGCDPNGGSISQTIPTVIGYSYKLCFKLTANCAGDPTKTVRARCGPEVRTFSKTCAGGGQQSWLTCEVAFVANSSATLIGFEAIGNDGSWNGPVIDAVSVLPISSISGVLPVSGPAIGGTLVTIVGDQFGTAPVVKVGGVLATEVTRISAQKLTALTPANLPGVAAVSVDGAVAENAFYYRPECGSDLDQNGVVDGGDMSILLLDWGQCYATVASLQAGNSTPFILQEEPAVAAPQSR